MKLEKQTFQGRERKRRRSVGYCTSTLDGGMYNTHVAKFKRDRSSGTFGRPACSGSTEFLCCTPFREVVPSASGSVVWKVCCLNFRKHPLNLKPTFLASNTPKNLTVSRTVELEPVEIEYLTATLSLKTAFGSFTLSDAVIAGIRSFPNSETRLKLAHLEAHLDFRAEHWIVILVRRDSLTDLTIVSIRQAITHAQHSCNLAALIDPTCCS